MHSELRGRTYTKIREGLYLGDLSGPESRLTLLWLGISSYKIISDTYACTLTMSVVPSSSVYCSLQPLHSLTTLIRHPRGGDCGLA